MEKLNLNKYLFHGMESWDNSSDGRKSMESIEILEKILNTGFIASRRLLKEILSEEEYKLLEKSHGINWNKNDWISIVPTLHPEIEGIHSVLEDYPGNSEDCLGFAYNWYVKKISIYYIKFQIITRTESKSR